MKKILTDCGIVFLFILISIWMTSLYWSGDTDSKISALIQDKNKAEDLYYNELAVNHPFVIMDNHSSLNQLKKKTNKLVLK